MRKKLLECSIHGLTLFRCKRRCWKRGGKKEKSYSDEYIEECFKCMSEGIHKKGVEPMQKKKRHVKI